MMMNGELAGFTIPQLGMGTMALAIEGRPDRDTAIRTIHAGLDAGVRYLDTAWSYYLPSEPGTGTAKDLGYGEQFVRDAFFFEDEVCQEITQFGREDTDTRSGQDIREPMPIIQYARQADACCPGISRHAVPRAAG